MTPDARLESPAKKRIAEWINEEMRDEMEKDRRKQRHAYFYVFNKNKYGGGNVEAHQELGSAEHSNGVMIDE